MNKGNSIISVVIPVKNGEATLDRCLDSLLSQTIANKLDIIILDSGSVDQSIQICEKYSVRIYPIAPADFNHGLTRNYGVTLAKGELIYFTVQDAYIAEADMLERMTQHFNDELVSGVVGMQATPPHFDKNPATWFKRISVPQIEIRHLPDGSFGELSIEQQYNLSNWDNVNAMYRKQALMRIPFRNTNFSEDWFWAFDAQLGGMKLVRDPLCVSYHYHHQFFSYVFRVNYILNYNHFLFFNVLPIYRNLFYSLSSSVYRIFRIPSLNLRQRLYWAFHNMSKEVGYFLSVFFFRIIYFLFKKEGLRISYEFFCKEVPQGSVKNSKSFK